MGVAVSNWRLARAVSLAGHLGVVSGTGMDLVLARRLQLGDLDGKMRHALAHFPIPDVAQRILDRYFVAGGKAEDAAFKSRPVFTAEPGNSLAELTIAANFAEVFLAKDQHSGPVGINLLEKIQLPTLHSLYGALLAGVDYVLMGAGIPRAIPGVLDKLSANEAAELKLDVEDVPEGVGPFHVRLDPSALFPDFALPKLQRPNFLAIVSSATLALTLHKKVGGVQGFVIEGPTAGGHNAPPRGVTQYSEIGEPIYGPRDVPDLSQFREIGLPFWMAGSYAEPEKLEEALAEGAEGIQVGTAFAFCEESGLDEGIKRRILEKSRNGAARVFTDPLASPTGFPFKVVELEGTVSDPTVYGERPRICDLGYLRKTYVRNDGKLGYRCPAEPVEDYVAKGGNVEDTVGRKCVCNGLLSTIGMGQIQKRGGLEPPIVTAGDEVLRVARFIRPGESSYSAQDVINYLTRAQVGALTAAS